MLLLEIIYKNNDLEIIMPILQREMVRNCAYYYYCIRYGSGCPASLLIELNWNADIKTSELKVFRNGIHNELIEHSKKKKMDIYQNVATDITSENDKRNFIKKK